MEPIPGLTLGAVVQGASLASLGDAEFAVIEQAFNDHAVLVFPEQYDLTDAQQVAFAKRFGPLTYEMMNMSNLKEGGTTDFKSAHGNGDLRSEVLTGTETGSREQFWYASLHVNFWWHTDSSFAPVSSKAAILYAETVPEEGGETEFADCRAAYDALDEKTKARIEDMNSYHSLRYSLGHRVGYFPKDMKYSGALKNPEAYLRPLVKVHPTTGRKSLFIASHCFGIPTISPEESAKFLDELMDFTTRHPRVYSHKWRPGDLVLWDNRCLLHRAKEYDLKEPRVMRSSRMNGDPATESALPAPGSAEVLMAELERVRALRQGDFSPMTQRPVGQFLPAKSGQ